MSKKLPKLSARQTTRRTTLLAAILITTSTIWLASCTSTPASKTPAPRITPPDPYTADGELVIKTIKGGATFTAPEDGVYLPYWYFRKLFNYIVDTQAAQEINEATSTKK